MKIGVETKHAAAKEAEQMTQMKTVGFLECFILGVGIAGGGIATSRWQYVLLGGIWEGLIATLICMVGYFMLDISLSELVGIVPFAGGSFGFVRCSLGPFWGFMAACVEAVVYMMYSVRTIQKLAQLVTVAAVTPRDYEPIWALCAIITVGLLHLRGGSWFWGTMIGCTAFTFLVMTIFMIGSFTFVDFHKYALDNGSNDGFIDKVGVSYMENCYYPMWFFMGICALPLASQRVKDAQVNIPKAIMSAMSFMSVVSIIVLFCVASQAPVLGPLLKDVHFVLGHGLTAIFGMSERYIVLLLMIPTYASATGFMFACKHQLSSMAASGLAPAIFKNRYGPNKIPVFALLFTVTLQFIIYLVVNHYLINNINATFKLCCAAACLMYIGILSAFITFKLKFEGMQRQFVSPVGIPGAVLGICIFSYILMGLLFFQHGNHAGPIALLVYLVIMLVYYFGYVQYVQFFSLEEQEKFMKAYILNANKKRKTSKWVKMMNTMFASTGLDKLFLRSTTRKTKGRTTMSRGSKSRNADEISISHPVLTAPSVSSPTIAAPSVSLKKNKVGILTVDVAVHGNLLSASVETVCTPTMAGSRSSTSLKKTNLATGALTWSGKIFGSDGESRKAFQLFHATTESNDEDDETIQGSVDGDGLGSDDDLGEQLIAAFPEHFVLPSAGACAASVDTQHECATADRSEDLLRNLQLLQSQPQLSPSLNEPDLEMGLPVVSGSNDKEDACPRAAETTCA